MLSSVKRLVGPILANDVTGSAAAWVLRNRIPHRGLTIDTSSPLVTPKIKASLLLRGYESGEYRFVRRYLPRDLDVVELGGSLGVISCTIRRHIAPERRLVIVEANPALAAILRRNLDLNGCSHNATIEQVAIAYGGAPSIRFSLGASSVSGRVATEEDTDSIEVPTTTLAALVDRHDLGTFALVSDIEGIEWSMLRNDRATIERADTIIMETHDNAEFGRFPDLIAELSGLAGFQLVDRHGPVVVLKRGTAVDVATR
jgi:FkbM family methyltransferase